MISLSVTPGDGETPYYEKTGDDLQSDVWIDGTTIRGVLKYVDGYSPVPDDTAKHHLVLKLSADGAEKIETKMTGGPLIMTDYVTVDDGWCVYSVSNKDIQKIYVKATKDGETLEKVYDLIGLTLAEKGDD